MTLDELLADHDPDVAALVRALLELLDEAGGGLERRVWRGWHGVGLRDEVAGHLVGIFPRERDVRVYFERGAALPDPAGILHGDGTTTRLLELAPGDPIPTAALGELVREAIALGASRRA